MTPTFVALAWSFWAGGVAAIVGLGALGFWWLGALARKPLPSRPVAQPTPPRVDITDSAVVVSDLDDLMAWCLAAAAASEADAESKRRVRERVLPQAATR